ncbi:MAG: gliding motility protein GldM [Flavobacteriaceae bacterium]|nr:gliding motility protein GldM [Flavobacteriaceae bacterium]
MASGNLSPRQKMINLMYLVFIAMLALNMSKEVLSAFGLLNERLAESNNATEARNAAFMQSLQTKASDQPEQYSDLYTDAQQIDALSEELDTYIAQLKDEMMATVKEDEQQDYEVQDKADFLDQKMFAGDDLSEAGKEFVAKIDAYREGMLALVDNPSIESDIQSKFETQPVERGDGVTLDWLKYHFEGFPLVASRTKLTQLQNDIKTTKSEVLQTMLAGEQASALALSNYNSFMNVSKSAFYSGENFNGEIILGRTDPNTVPKRAELTLDGRKLVQGKDYTFVGGKVQLNVNAGSPGDHKIEGTLYYGEDGDETEVAVSTGFATISMPNAAVISADKMNVVYRGVDNPMTVSIPGIPDNKVNASAPGLSKVSGSNYVMRPGSGRTVTITATGTLPDGKPISTPAEFRIKDIPAPVGAVRGETGIVRMQREGLEKSTISAVLEDFDFDLDLQVTGFSFKVSGQPTVNVSGTRLDGAALSNLRRAKRGETVQIYDIESKIQGSSVKLKRTAPVFIELTN